LISLSRRSPTLAQQSKRTVGYDNGDKGQDGFDFGVDCLPEDLYSDWKRNSSLINQAVPARKRAAAMKYLLPRDLYAALLLSPTELA
jgi:hypothetical protein